MNANMMQYKKSKYNVLVNRNNEYSLLFNSFSGSFIELDSNEYAQYLNNNFSNDTLKQTLINQGFLISQKTDEYNKVVFYEHRLIFRETERLSFVIAPTLNCNMNCVYCFEGDRQNSNMALDTEERLLSYIFGEINQQKKVKELKVSWFGGEPTLRLDTIQRLSERIIEFCAKKQIKYSAIMISNGLLINHAVAQILAKCQVKKLQISLDGTSDVYCKLKQVPPYIYEKVINNIQEICDLINITIRLNCTCTNNVEIEALVKQFSGQKKIALYLAPIQNYNNIFCDKDDISITTKDFVQFKKYIINKYSDCNIIDQYESPIEPIGISCSLLKIQNYVIGPYGEMYNCEHDLGNIDKVIGDISTGIYYNRYYMEQLAPKHLTKCKSCNIFPLCMSGCQSEVRKFNRTNEYCINKKNSLKQYLIDYYEKEVQQ